MINIEDNPKNPTIEIPASINIINYFIIKYKTEDNRVKFANLVIKLIKKHEIKDFHLEEKKAYEEERILYNMHTIATGNKFTYEDLEKKYLKCVKS